MSFDLTIYHNLDSRFFEFKPGDMLRPTDRLTKVMMLESLPDTLLINVNQTLENIYMQLNMPVPEQDWAKAYRLGGHRSLSVGDVVSLGEMAFAVANAGFKSVSITASQVINGGSPPEVSLDVTEDQIPQPGSRDA